MEAVLLRVLASGSFENMFFSMLQGYQEQEIIAGMLRLITSHHGCQRLDGSKRLKSEMLTECKCVALQYISVQEPNSC